MSAAAGQSARCAARRPPSGRPRPTPARRLDALRPTRPAAPARSSRAAPRSSRSRCSARCTGWRCSSRPPPIARGRRSAPACWRSRGLLGAARLRGARRALAAAATCVVAAGLAFLAAGVPDELLRPDRWDALAAGIERGISALPGVRVPYRGIDEWTRIVIPLGGTVLVVLAAALAFWPRRAGAPASRSPRSSLLVTLYAVPAVALDFEGEFLRGALLALLVIAFLRLERLRLGEAGAAAALAAAPRSRR